MSTKLKPETIRRRVKKNLELMLTNAGIDIKADLYHSKIEEYMELYDHCREMQAATEEDGFARKTPRLYMDYVKEIRQLEKSMRDLLDWFGIDPKMELPKEEDYDL